MVNYEAPEPKALKLFAMASFASLNEISFLIEKEDVKNLNSFVLKGLMKKISVNKARRVERYILTEKGKEFYNYFLTYHTPTSDSFSF